MSKNTIDGIVSALSYKDPLVKRVIELFKYKFIQELSEDLAAALLNEISAQGLGDYFREFILIPVPLHKKRFNWRGFNQAELLAASLAKINGIETNTDLIIRSKNTKPQTKLSATERKQNLTDAFREQAAQIAGKKFLLVDDVVTTGATLNELAKLLKKSKAQEVWAVTVAHG
ncbi:MAG: ComF family protein [Candidatus Doudnabacteria bacterium]|nr:ComF family protein [Candidatus Doudnabacteria bacterium]